MKEINKTATIQAFGWYVLRTPLFSANQLDLLTHLHTAQDFKQLFDHPLFKEAVYLASPGLYGQFEKWLQGTIKFKKNPEKEEQKLIKSLLKYWLRAAYRCTPFATFASVSSPAPLASNTHIVVDNIVRYNRIDAMYLALATNELMAPTQEAVYRPNPSLYAYDQHSLRYFERITKVDPDAPYEYLYQYNFSKVDSNAYLQGLLKFCTSGATRQQMLQWLIEQGIDKTEAHEYIKEVIVSQLLTGSAQLSTIGQEYQEYLLPMFSQGKVLLEKIKTAQNIQDFQALTHTLTQRMARKLPEIQKVISSFFQVDTIRTTTHNQLAKTWAPKIAQVIDTLNQTVPPSVNQSLEKFKETFKARYQAEFIPLNQVLDPENGIPYPTQQSSLQAPFALLALPMLHAQSAHPIPHHPWQDFVLEQYLSTIKNNKKCLDLTSQEMRQVLLNTDYPSLPDTLSAVVSLVAKDKVSLANVVPSGASLLGRFCHADAHLNTQVKTITDFEQAAHPDIIMAEIAHNPAHPKTYNISNRPGNIRKHKILLATNPAYFTDEEAIYLHDLLVGVVQQEIVLYDKKRQKRIVPQRSNAHNYVSSNYPLYQFLCDVSFQNTQVGHWSWGWLKNQAFLPRVEIDGIIVSPAQWRIQQLTDLDNAALPQKVVLSNADHQLLLDRKHELSQEILSDELKKHGTIVLEEYLFEELIVKNSNGQGYTNQFIIPFYNMSPQIISSRFPTSPGTLHSLGGQWVYLKIYCGKLTMDKLLKNEVYALAQTLQQDGVIQQWFFIRYTDKAGDHIRLRFQTPTLQPSIFKQINEVLQHYISSRKIRIVYDAYLSEEQRYGGKKSLQLCEQIFHWDSLAIVESLQLIEQDKEDKAGMYQVVLAMKNVDFLLSDFGYTLAQKLALVKQLAQRFKEEFKVDKSFKKSMAQAYRKLQTLDTLETAYDEVFQRRSAAIGPLLAQIKQYIDQGVCSGSPDHLFSSISHMSLNRLFLEKPRAQEMLTYDFLALRYQTTIARLAQSSANKT